MKAPEFVTDYFGNEIRVGDKIIFAVTKHTSLAIGEVTSIGKSGNYVMAKIIIAPFGGYYKSAVKQIGQEVKVMLTKTVEEEEGRWEYDDKENWKQRGKFIFDYYDTNYVYGMKYTGKIPETPQYTFVKSEPQN